MIDLRDAFHTLRLALSSQKYCGITPYYGSPTYHYLRMGMGMSVSPQIWQQFVDLVFQDDLIKREQNFDVIMDCKAQPHRALLGYPFHNTAAHMEAMPTREGI